MLRIQFVNWCRPYVDFDLFVLAKNVFEVLNNSLNNLRTQIFLLIYQLHLNDRAQKCVQSVL